MENLLNRITINPLICHGKPTIRNKRYTVDLILDLLSAGMTAEEILEDYPALQMEDISACLVYAGKLEDCNFIELNNKGIIAHEWIV